MLEKLIKTLNNTLLKTINNQSDEIKYLRNQLKEQQEKLLEDFIITINELQDTHSMHIEEEDKQKVRNSIIDYKRKQYVEKLIELSNTRQSNR